MSNETASQTSAEFQELYAEAMRLIRKHMQPGDTIGKMFMRVARELDRAKLSEAVRVPLHELQADIDYLIGRVVADGSCAPSMAMSIKRKLTAIEAALQPSSTSARYTKARTGRASESLHRLDFDLGL